MFMWCVGGSDFDWVLWIHGVVAEVVTKEAECYIDGFSSSLVLHRGIKSGSVQSWGLPGDQVRV